MSKKTWTTKQGVRGWERPDNIKKSRSQILSTYRLNTAFYNANSCKEFIGEKKNLLLTKPVFCEIWKPMTLFYIQSQW